MKSLSCFVFVVLFLVDQQITNWSKYLRQSCGWNDSDWSKQVRGCSQLIYVFTCASTFVCLNERPILFNMYQVSTY